MDLDFFSAEPAADLDAVKTAVTGAFARVEVRAQTDAALHLLCDGLPVDFVRYPYAPLDAPKPMLGVAVAGLVEISPS